MSMPYWCTKSERSELGKAWAASRGRKRVASGVDAETLRRRALDDERGEVMRHGCAYTATTETAWHVVRSVGGRVTQFDLVANGSIVRTAGRRRLPKRFRP